MAKDRTTEYRSSRKEEYQKQQTQQYKDAATAATEETDESSVYDSILSTCCCGGSFPGQSNSLADKKNKKKNQLHQHPHQQQPQEPEEDVDQSPKFWDRLSDVALFLVGGAPPVKFVKCMECASADGSELTMPRVLTDLADEYDESNKWKVQNMWSISEQGTDGDATADNYTNSASISDDDNMLNPVPPSSNNNYNTTTIKPMKSSGGNSRIRLGRSGSGSGRSMSGRSRSGSRSSGRFRLLRSSSSSKGEMSKSHAASVQTDSNYLMKSKKGSFGGPSRVAKPRVRGGGGAAMGSGRLTRGAAGGSSSGNNQGGWSSNRSRSRSTRCEI